VSTTTYGQKGGTGPTAGKKASVYDVMLPDGKTVRKSKFHAAPLKNPVGYVYQHKGNWFVASVDEPNDDRLKHYTVCPAKLVTS
jgi:hypothetical protein